MIAFLRASIFAATSFPSRDSLISVASAGVPLSKWTMRLHDFSIVERLKVSDLKKLKRSVLERMREIQISLFFCLCERECEE